VLRSRPALGLAARRALLLGAVVVLAAGVVLALRSQPEVLRELSWPPAALVLLVGFPVTVLLNAAGFALSGRMVGRRIGLARAVEVSVIGSAANLLPLPGAAVTRVAALRGLDVPLREGTSATFLIALIWMGAAAVWGGAWLVVLGSPLVGGASVLGGAAALAAGAVATARAGGRRIAAWALAAESALVLADALRVWLCLAALGSAATFAQASALTVAGVAGSVVGVVPAGLGVREVVAAALSPLAGLPASYGFLAATLNRVIGLSALIPLALVLAARASSAPVAASREGESES
jgi:hypothetical protein